MKTQEILIWDQNLRKKGPTRSDGGTGNHSSLVTWNSLYGKTRTRRGWGLITKTNHVKTFMTRQQ